MMNCFKIKAAASDKYVAYISKRLSQPYLLLGTVLIYFF